jgi:hypothetical protein
LAARNPGNSTNGTTAPAGTKKYTALSDQEYIKLHNPARGFSGHLEAKLSDPSTYFTTANIAGLQAEDKYVHQIVFFLDTRVDGTALSDAEIASMEAMLAAVQEAGSKASVRFAYSFQNQQGPFDPPLASVKSHITQLTPLLDKYSDVVYIVQQGFVS